jgi:hypothetical protein
MGRLLIEPTEIELQPENINRNKALKLSEAENPSVGLLRHSKVCLEEPRKITKTLHDSRSEIRNERLPEASLHCYRCDNQLLSEQ